MKKSKLSLALVAGLMSVGALAGCDNEVKTSRDGFLLIVNGDKEHPLSVTADKILGDYYDDSTKYQAIYDTIYSIIVKNYFEEVEETFTYHGESKELGKAEKSDLLKKAQQKVDDDIAQAKSNADTNNTKWKKEMETICSSKGVEVDKNYESLKLHYLYELEKERFENNFYLYHVEEIKNGDESSEKITYSDAENTKQLWNGYFKQEVPYHVSHILVKLEDSSGTNYSNGTISEANAIKLADVVDALGAPESTYNDSFATIAHEYSEDTGSRELYGDLGIMDYSTNFVNEFKLGIYAYENFYYTTGDARSKGSEIDLVTDTDPSSIGSRYADVVKGSFGSAGIPTIDKSVFDELRAAAKKETDSQTHKSVLDGSSSVFPRNVIYNKYLNRHEVAFITGGTALAANTKKTVGYWSYASETTSALKTLGPVLSAKVDGEWTPILCVRAGSDYQGIHFIVVNRSAFEKGGSGSVHSVSQSDYYTTFYPDQQFYPTVDGQPSKDPSKKLRTFVNFSSDETTKTKSRAEEFASKLKSFDSEKLQKFIFKKYMKAGQIKLADEKLEKALEKWISSSVEKKVEERSDSWKKTWNDYLDTLLRQNSERQNRMPEICKIAFDYGNSNKSLYDLLKEDTENYPTIVDESTFEDFVDLYADELVELKLFDTKENAINYLKTEHVKNWFNKEGGICNDGKEHL